MDEAVVLPSAAASCVGCSAIVTLFE